MGDLQQIISDLINQHGQEAVQEAVNRHLASQDMVVPPKCPSGYYWNGSECVLDVG
jgi:hypothetical protein